MSSYNKNLVFTAACIGMCFFGISMITLGAVLPSLTTKLALDNLQATALVTFLPLGLLGGSLLFGPIVDRFGHKALLLLSCLVVLLGLEGIAFFTSIPIIETCNSGILVKKAIPRTGRNRFLHKYSAITGLYYRNRIGRWYPEW